MIGIYLSANISNFGPNYLTGGFCLSMVRFAQIFFGGLFRALVLILVKVGLTQQQQKQKLKRNKGPCSLALVAKNRESVLMRLSNTISISCRLLELQLELL